MGKFSTIPAVKTALASAIAARPALSGVTVQRGVIDPPQLEMVELFQSTTQRDYRAIRTQPHPVREQIEITIRVTALSTADRTLATAEDRMWAICDEIDAAYRADITLGNILEMGKLERAEQRYWRFDKFRGSVLFITLTGQASFS